MLIGVHEDEGVIERSHGACTSAHTLVHTGERFALVHSLCLNVKRLQDDLDEQATMDLWSAAT